MGKPVRVTNGTRTFDVPEERLQDAQARGYEVAPAEAPENAATAPQAAASKESRARALMPSQTPMQRDLSRLVSPNAFGTDLAPIPNAFGAAAGNSVMQGFLPHAMTVLDLARSHMNDPTTPMDQGLSGVPERVAQLRSELGQRLPERRQELENIQKAEPRAFQAGDLSGLVAQIAGQAVLPVGAVGQVGMAGLQGAANAASTLNDLDPSGIEPVLGEGALNAGVAALTHGALRRMPAGVSGAIARPFMGAGAGGLLGGGAAALRGGDAQNVTGNALAGAGTGLAMGLGGEVVGGIGRGLIPREAITEQRLAAGGTSAAELQNMQQMLGQEPVTPSAVPQMQDRLPPRPAAPRPAAVPAPVEDIGTADTVLAPQAAPPAAPTWPDLGPDPAPLPGRRTRVAAVPGIPTSPNAQYAAVWPEHAGERTLPDAQFREAYEAVRAPGAAARPVQPDVRPTGPTLREEVRGEPTRPEAYRPVSEELRARMAQVYTREPGVQAAVQEPARHREGSGEPTQPRAYVRIADEVRAAQERAAREPGQPAPAPADRVAQVNAGIQAERSDRARAEGRFAEGERIAAEHVPNGNQTSAAPAAPASPPATPPPRAGADVPSRQGPPTVSSFGGGEFPATPAPTRPTMAQEAQQAIYRHDIQGGFFTSAREMARRAAAAKAPIGTAIGEHAAELARRRGGHVVTRGEVLSNMPERLTGLHGLGSPQPSEQAPAMQTAEELHREFDTTTPSGGSAATPEGYRHALDYFGKRAQSSYNPNSGVTPDAAELAGAARRSFRNAADEATQTYMGDEALAADRARHAEHGALSHLEQAAGRSNAQSVASGPAVGRFAAARHLARKYHYGVARLGEALHGMHGTHVGTGGLGTFVEAARRVAGTPAATQRMLEPVAHFLRSETDEEYRKAHRGNR